MTADIYKRLREQLDQYSIGFPETESRTEMKILRKLFTEEEADMYLNMSLMLESPKAVAERLKRDPEQVGGILERMFEKGLVFRLKKGGEAKYGASAFVVGIYEFQLRDMDREFAELMEKYMEEAFGKSMSAHMVPLRTVPVNRSLDVAWPVAPYEDIKAIMRSKDNIAVADCVCRKQQDLIDKGCGKPMEVCFSFGSHADYYVDKGMARRIDQEEAMEILDLSEEAGLVPQPYNAKNPGGICNCCGDCCGVLRALRKQARPVDKVMTNYYAEVDSDQCTACETCIERCQMDAIAIGEEGMAEVSRDRCIGCGLCVTTCPEEALTLMYKSDEERREPPATAKDTMMEITGQRGTSLIPLEMMRAQKES
jgi:ferredoxin